MQVQGPVPDSQGLGTKQRQLLGADVAVHHDGSFMLEWFLLRANLEESTLDNQDVLGMKFDVRLVKDD